MKSGLRNLLSAAMLASFGLASSGASAALGSATGTASAAFTGITVSTTGTASVLFTESPFDVFSAIGTTSGGTADPLNDGMFFDSQFSPLGEGTAINAGSGAFTASESFASAEAPLPGDTTSAAASTLVELEMELSGAGMVTLDIDYDLYADTLNMLPGGFASAGVTAYTVFEGPEEATIDLLAGTGFLDDFGTLTLSFMFDDLGLGPQFDYLTVETFANVEVSAVPLPPAAVLFTPALLGLAGLRRRG